MKEKVSMRQRFRLARLRIWLVCLLLGMAGLLPKVLMPASAQAPAPALSFTPAPKPAPPKLVFTPSVASANVAALNAQIAAADAALTAANSKVAALTTQNAALTPIQLGQPFLNTTGKLFFLHTQTSDIGYGGTADGKIALSVAGATRLITEARAASADGLELDLIADDQNYNETLVNYYLAANAVNVSNGWTPGKTGAGGTPATGQTNALGVGKFFLYVKFDFSNTSLETAPAMLAVLSQALTDPANLTWHNPKTSTDQPVFSCYTGGGGRSWASLLGIFGGVNDGLKAQGITPLFVYGGESTNPDGSPTDGSLAAYTAWAKGCVLPFAGAVCEFPGGASPLGPQSDIFEKEKMAAAVHAAGLLWQPAFNCDYSQMNQSTVRFLADFYGTEGIDAQFRSIVGPQQADLWATGMTGDDRGEASNILSGPLFFTPPLPAWVGDAHYNVPGWYKNRAGLQKALAYYLTRLKTGTWPAITSDRVCAAYIAQTPQCLETPTADPLGGLHAVLGENGNTTPDGQPFTVRVASFLSASAYLRLTCAAPAPPATHTHLTAWVSDPGWLYDLANPFTGAEVGQTLQVTYGAGWATGNYVIDRVQGVAGQDGFVMMVHLAAATNNGNTGGQGTVYPAGATLPTLPPAPLVSIAFVPAGLSFRRLPAQAGTVKLELLRNNIATLTLTGEDIVSTAAVANSNTTWIWGGN